MGHFLNMIDTYLCHISCLQFSLTLSCSKPSPNVYITDDINGLISLYTHFLESKKIPWAEVLYTFPRLGTVQKSLIHYIQIWVILIRRCRREWRELIFIQKSVQRKKNERLQGFEVEIAFSFSYMSTCKTHILKINQSINQHPSLVTKSEQKEIIEYIAQAGVMLFGWEAKPFFLLTAYHPSIPHPDQVKSFWNTQVLSEARSSFLAERESDQTYIELIRKVNLSSVPISFIYPWKAWQKGWDMECLVTQKVLSDSSLWFIV